MTKSSADDDWTPSRDDYAYAFAYIGEFMFNWAALESEINRSIHQLLNLEGPSAYVTTANMGVRDKLNLVRTLIHLYCKGSERWMKDANKELDKIADMSAHRNLVAHTMFTPAANGGVSFLIIKAKGKFEVPNVVWMPADFAAKRAEMDRLEKKLEKLTETAVLVRTRIGYKNVLGELLSNPNSGGLGILGLLANHLQGGPGSQEPDPETASQTEELPA